MVTAASFKFQVVKHDVYFISCGPVLSKIEIEAGPYQMVHVRQFGCCPSFIEYLTLNGTIICKINVMLY